MIQVSWFNRCREYEKYKVGEVYDKVNETKPLGKIHICMMMMK